VRPGRALVLGAITVALVEATETSIFWALRAGITPWRIFRYIASGFFGQDAFEGGPGMMWLGVAIHFFNAFVIVGVYMVAGRHFPMLVRHPVVFGLAYGAAVHLVMQFVVIPLSAASHAKAVDPWLLLHSLLSQAVTVGLPSALFARAAARRPVSNSLSQAHATG
jgi:hypothetical protein